MTPINFTNAESMKYNDMEVLALYTGGVLLWSRPDESGGDDKVYGTNQFVGKFIEGTAAGDMRYSTQGVYTNIPTQYVNAQNEFDWADVVSNGGSQRPSSFSGFMKLNHYIERIDHLFYTGNATSFESAFESCSQLKYVNLNDLETDKVTTLKYMLSKCTALTEARLRGFVTATTTIMTETFYNDSKLAKLDLTGWDMSNVAYLSKAFFGCTSLTEIVGPVYGISVDLDLRYSPLTHDSAMVIINGLAQVPKKQTLIIHATTMASLSQEEKALAAAKGWTLAQPA